MVNPFQNASLKRKPYSDQKLVGAISYHFFDLSNNES